ncbi:MAG: complexin-2 [Hespellia sp.]|nr:complexin-2 [Hespellia sp.]
MKYIQISEELFSALIKYHLLEIQEMLPEIEKGLMDKMDRIVMRELYTQSKTALSEEEKEKARQEYLDKKGIPESYRW